MFSPVINRLAGLFFLRRQSEWKNYFTAPEKLQEEQFRFLIRKAKNTEYGRKYEFDQIDSYNKFNSKLPLTDYSVLHPYIEKMINGQPDILWPGRIKYFAQSSGTTSTRSKFIPISAEILEDCHYRGGKDMLMAYLQNNENTKLFGGKILKLGGSIKQKQQSEIIIGDLSGIMIDLLPFWAEMRSEPEENIALLPDWEEKIDKIVRKTSKEDIRGIAGIPSWYLLLIKSLLDYTGKKHLIDIWPELEVFFHGGIDFEPYRNRFEKLIGKPINYMNIYNASEGFFGFQDDLNERPFILTLDYRIFYEFIPMEDFRGTSSENVIPLEGIREGVNYAMVISTASGLWRYILGDTVRFVSTRPYRFELTGRTKYFINIVGEEVIEDNTNKALAETARHFGTEIVDYTVAPVFPTEKTKGFHEWLVEFARPPENLADFEKMLDNELQKLNSDYEVKRRNNISLKPLKIHMAKPGLFYNWLKKHDKLGGQHKVPRLSSDRKIFDELLQMNQ